MKQQVIYSIAAMALVPGAANAADALTYAQFTAQEVGGWNNAQFKANLADFKARVTDYINDISDYDTPDKDTNVDLNDCKQLGEIDWTDPANQTEDNYNTYRLYEFVPGYDGPKVFEQKLADAKKAINGAEAIIWQTNAQTLLDEFTAGGTGLDARIAAVKAQGVTEEYTDGDNTSTISMAVHADALTDLLNEDGVGIEDLLKDFVEFLEGYDGTGDPLPVTEYKAKFADPDGEFVKGVAEAKKLVENLEAYNEYLGVYAADCRTELANLNNLLEALQASIDNKAAEIDQRLVTQCRYNTYRFRAFTAVLNEFIKTAEANYNYTSNAWKYPTKLMGIALPAIDWDGDGTNDFDARTINYTDSKDQSGHMAGAITTLLGSSSANDFGWGTNAIAVMSDDEAFPIEKYSNNFSIRHTISYLKWRMQDYVAAKEALDAAIQKATKDYNKEIVRLETEIQAQDEKAATADFDEFKTFLENAKNDLYKKVKTAEKTGLEARIAQYEQSYKEGVIYDENGDVVDMVDDALNWKNGADNGFADATGTTQAEKWIVEVQGVITALQGDIDDYVAKATDAANRYNTLEDLINGTENDDQLAKKQADLKFSEFPDKVQELYQNDYTQITTDLATLTEAITDATKTVDDTGLDLQINDADWDNTAATSANWNVLDLDNDPLTYADIAKKIAVLKNNLDAAKAEYDAWQQLLTDADDLANRLKDASEALTDATDELADPTYNPADYYGYKGIGDDAAQNTKMAKMITDYVAALKAKADEAYGVGTADEGLTTGAKDFLDGGYKATPLVDTDDDSTLDFSWNTADTDIKLLETGGDIANAVENWVTFRTAVVNDQTAMETFFNQEVNGVKVNEHGIYTDDNHWYVNNDKGNKYKTNEDVWKGHIETIGTDIIEHHQGLDAKAHFDAIKLANYIPFNIATQLGLASDANDDAIKDEIAKDMADYDAAAQLKLAEDLNDQLAGTDGYIADAQDAWQTAYDAVYTNQTDFWNEYDADTQVWNTNVITGNSKTLKGMWDAMKDAIDQIETDRATIEATPMDKTNAANSWNALSALKKQLDGFTSSDEFEGELTVDNCIAKLQEYTEHIMEGLEFNYNTYKSLVSDDTDNPGKVNQLNTAIAESKAEVAGYIFIAANGETATYEGKYDDLKANYSDAVAADIQTAYKDFANFKLVEYDNEWKETDVFEGYDEDLDNAAIRLEVLDQYVKTYDEYLHVNTALNGDATITAAIADYEKKYGNPGGAFVELDSDDDVYGTAAARANFKDMLTALNTASGTALAELTGEEANLPDIKTLLDSERTDYSDAYFDTAADLLVDMQAALEKLGGLTAEEGENYSTFKGSSMAERVYDYAIQGILEQAKDNQVAYDNILDMKQKLSDKVKQALTDLAAQEDTSYEDADGNIVDPKGDLIKDIKDNYEPLPTNMAAEILDSYEAGESVAQNQDSPDPSDAADRQYYILKNAYDELVSKLTDWATDGYANAIAGKNADIYSDQITALYLQAMEKFNQAVADVKEFKTPEYESLKDAYEEQILLLNNGLYKAPEQLLDARQAAQNNLNTANEAPTTYDPTADVAAIQAIIDNTIDASFNAFIAAMQTAAQAAWDAVKGDLQDAIDAAKTEVETNGYFESLDETKDAENNVTAQAGVEYADAAAIAALFSAQQDIWDAADALTDLMDGTNPAYDEFLKLDRMLTGNVQAGEEPLSDITAGVKTKLNEVANLDLTIRGQLVNGAPAIAGTVLGDKAIIEGKGAVVNYNGKDYQYTYEEAVNALAQTTGKSWQSFVDRFNELVTATYTAAENLRTTYNNGEQLPSATIDGAPTNTRLEVMDLLNLFDGGNADIESFATILKEIKVIYNQYTSDMAYNVELAALETDFATEAAGIKDLYVGELFVYDLNVLEAAISAEKASKTNLTTVNGLRAQLNTLVADAKSAERTELATELMKMEGEYDDLIGNVYKDDAGKKEELIAMFATPGGKLNIVENENTVTGYDAATPYEDYLTIETNLALIKTEIGKKIYEVDKYNELAVTDEMLEGMVTTLEAAIAACENYESEYIPGQKLLEPTNPEMSETFYLEDFGLYSYYSADDYKIILEGVDVIKESLDVIKANLAKYKEAGTILLYNEKLTKELDEAKGGLKTADDILNNPDKPATPYAKNKAELDKAAVWNATYVEQQAFIDAFATFDEEGNVTGGTLKEALDRIEELGETWNTNPTLATVIDRINAVQNRLTALYFCGLLPADYDVAKAYYSPNGSKPTYKGDGYWYITPVSYGLDYLSDKTNAAVDAAALSHAKKQLDDVTKVYDAVEDKLIDTKMRAADKEAMLEKLAGYYTELLNLDLTGGIWDGKGVALTNDNVDDYDAAVQALKDKLATDITYDEDGNITDVDGAFADEIKAELVGDLNNGDGTGDGVVDVDDLDILLGYVTDGVPEGPNHDKIFAAADLNNDKVIDISDALILIDMITNQDVSEYIWARSTEAFTETATAEVISQEGNRQRIAISLNNWRHYAAFQMDVKLPKGMTIVGQELSDRANGKTMLIGHPDGKTRFVAYDMEKTALTGNDGVVLYIDVETANNYRGGDIQYSNIIFATTESVGVRFYIGDSETTGISTSKFDTVKQTIYNMGGRMLDSLKKGINIIRGNNGSQKVIKK